MDEELEELALSALTNAFWSDFSALVNSYLTAAEGLDVDSLEALLGDHTSVYGRDTEERAVDGVPNIYVEDAQRHTIRRHQNTMLDALNAPNADKIYLRSHKVFEKQNGEWYFVD